MIKTIMEKETREAPQKITEQLRDNVQLLEKMAAQIRCRIPKFVVMIGRGSSDHAGVFAKYLIEVELGIPVVAAAPSVVSIFSKQLQMADGLALIISQSGSSPDILAQAEMAKRSDAFCVALVNDESSPLSNIVDVILPLKAGEEKSIAATKSYLATLSALLQLVAVWGQCGLMSEALKKLPELLNNTIDEESQFTVKNFMGVDNCLVLGRGFGYAIAREIALKLKEVCCIHAEAFSSAEFIHGPVTLAEKNITILNVGVVDETLKLHHEQIEQIKARGANLVHLHQTHNETHPRLAPLALMMRFYLDVAKVAVSLGFNPDTPVGLQKVTRTL